MPVSRWLSIRPTLVNATKAAHSYTPQSVQVRARIQPAKVTQVYTGRSPAVNVSSMQLAWNANPAGENVTGYKLYFGSAPDNYNGVGSPIQVGNVTSYSLSVTQQVTTYLRLSAVNASGESALSAEIHN